MANYYTTQSSYFDNSVGNPGTWANWIAQWNPADAQEIAESYFRNCALVSLNADLCLAQASLETAHFTSAHYVNEHNMAGVGITGNTTQGHDFGSIEGGVKGHLAHLCAYVYTIDKDPQPALARTDSQWADIRPHFNDGIPYIHTLEQPDMNEGAHRWAASGFSYVTNIIAVANIAVDIPIPAPITPPSPPVVFPVADPTILQNDTHVNVWDAGEWPGRAAYPVRAIVLHVMAGSYSGSISWFHDSAAQASANYCVSYTGEITETVNPDTEAPWANGISNIHNTALPAGLADLADGVPNANWVTVSIETEGGSPEESGYPRPEEYSSVVHLMAWLCRKYNLHPSTDTICRHTYFDTVNRPNCPGDHWDFNRLIADVLAAMNIPTPIDTSDVHGIQSNDGNYRSFFFVPGQPVIGNSIKKYWEKCGDMLNGTVDLDRAIWMYGYPLGQEIEIVRDNGSTIRGQIFERAILEWHPEFQGTENEVLESRIGEMMLNYLNKVSMVKTGTMFALPFVGDERVNAKIDNRIQAYYDRYDGLRHFGYAITGVVNHPADGMEGQFFERAFIEIHPDGLVVGRRLGAEYLDDQQSASGGPVPVVMA